MTTGSNLLIRGLSLISSIGTTLTDWEAAFRFERAPTTSLTASRDVPVFRLASKGEGQIASMRMTPAYRRLDRSTLCALAVASTTLEALDVETPLGCITIGSSRGPTSSIESTFEGFLREGQRVPTFTSPITTAGNIVSWVAQHYLAQHRPTSSFRPTAALSTSMTCSSAFHSLLVAVSFIRSGMASVCMFGGSESSLTPYSIAQLEALRIYTSEVKSSWPCQPLTRALSQSSNATPTVTLGEAAGMALLLPRSGDAQEGDLELLGLGWSLEEIPSATGISADGAAFQNAMKMAARDLKGRAVDAVIAHAPGTTAGDDAELAAIRATFGDVPVCSTKHLTGHTYGASGMVSLGMAAALLSGVRWSGFPYADGQGQIGSAKDFGVIAVNTAGFGGNAISAIVSKAR